MARLASRISIREMEMIGAILTYGTMAKAAQKLNISQPAISRMVKHAEQRTGLQLFERRGSKLIPTRDLAALSGEFERVFASIDRVQNLTWALGAGLARPVSISTMAVLAETLLTPAIAELRAAHPRTPMAVKLNHRHGVEKDVIREEADLGLVHGVFHHDSIAAVRLCSARVVCLMHRQHPLANREGISPQDLANENIISMGRLSPLSQQVVDAFEGAGVERRIAIQIADSGIAAHFCAHGLGLALLDPFFVGTVSLADLVIRPFLPAVVTECFAIFSNRRVLSELETELLERLQAAGTTWERTFAELLGG
jgi:DNA-binding transcriptional LysR family regulator